MFGAELSRLRSLQGIKWTRYPDDVLPGWVADMDFEPPDVVKQAVQDLVERGDFGYNLAGRDRLVEAWSDWQQRYFDWRPPADECGVYTATLNVLSMVLEVMTEPGDGVVMCTPIYHPFRMITEKSGRRIVEVPLDPPDWRLDGDRFAAAIDDTTRLVAFANPHNPLGRMFDHDELAAVVDASVSNDLVMVSDEIWCDLTHQPGHIPMWARFPEIRDRCITLGSASKSFSLAGLRTAVCHIGDPRVRQAFDTWPDHFIGMPSSLGAAASLAAWTQGHEWLETIRAQLTANRDHLAQRVADDLPGVTMHPPDATYLAWLDFAGTALADDPEGLLLEHGKVGAHGGAKFSPEWRSNLRLNFATSPTILDAMIDRMAETLATLERS